jgi:hypothetical protein
MDFMENAARAAKELTLDEVMTGWSLKAQRCFESLRAATRIGGTRWSGYISPFGREPVAMLQLGHRPVCQVHARDNQVVVRMIRGETFMGALRRDKSIPPAVKRTLAMPGKIKIMAELPVAHDEDARMASTILAIKAACLAQMDGAGPVDPKLPRRSTPVRRPTL